MASFEVKTGPSYVKQIIAKASGETMLQSFGSLQATSHLTISMCGQRETGKI